MCAPRLRRIGRPAGRHASGRALSSAFGRHYRGSMALLYRAQLVPSKLELLGAWVPEQPWLGGVEASELEVVGAFRFDDPRGEVGIETHLLRLGDGPVVQVPVTYRDAPLVGVEPSLLGTAEHSVLGRRWVYDGCCDPVYVRALAHAIVTGGTQAELEVQTDAGLQRREPTMQVQGSGAPGVTVPGFDAFDRVDQGAGTLLRADGTELVVVRVLDREGTLGALASVPTLTGTWPGRDRPAVLAFITRSFQAHRQEGPPVGLSPD